jgi:hypothetical protein
MYPFYFPRAFVLRNAASSYICRNKHLLFGYLNIEKKATLEWYSELVKACLPDQQEIEINPYFCAGTVLALSNMRRYLWLYHRKHPGIVPSKVSLFLVV